MIIIHITFSVFFDKHYSSISFFMSNFASSMRDKYCALTSEKNFPSARGSLEARRHSRAPKLTKVKRLNINNSWQAPPPDTGKRAEIVGKTDSLVNLCEYIEIFRILSLVFAFLSINLQNNNIISQRDKMNN